MAYVSSEEGRSPGSDGAIPGGILATGGDEDTMVSWMLQRLGNILQRYGVSYFGKVESCVKYNPELHEFIRGFETGSNDVRIKCPGCEWQDPAGKKVILARARVTGLQGGRNGLQIGH